MILFDLEDRPAAHVEALDRFVAGEAAASGGVAPFADFIRAFQQHDWEAAHRTLAPDFVFDDHRTLGLGRLDRDRWIASLQAQAAPGPRLAGEVRRVLAWNHHGLVVELRTYGALWGADGASESSGPFENALICVFMTTGDRIRSSHSFDRTDTDRALARFAELSAEPEGARGSERGDRP